MNKGFGLASVKQAGSEVKVDPGYTGIIETVAKSTYFEFSVEDTRIQEVVDHLKLIGIDCDPRAGY